MTTKTEAWLRLGANLQRYGITATDGAALARAERTLHKWAELECGDGNDYASWAIERDPETDKPYRVTYPHAGASYRTPIADREASAKRKVQSILARYPGLIPVYQGDPRGCALSIVRLSDIPAGADECNWASYGFPVCV
jgi:hypothetical protein